MTLGNKHSPKSIGNKRWASHPLRKIVKTEFIDGRTFETLECGHKQYAVQDLIGETSATRRRCRKCRQSIAKAENE